MPTARRKGYPLPRRFSAALSERAYARLRELNARTGLSNNYLLTVLLENLDQIARPGAVDEALDAFVAEHGAPARPGDGDGSSGRE